MYRLLETIKIKNGRLQNIRFHNERFNRSRKELFGIDETVHLENEIHIQQLSDNIIYKCRIVFGRNIEKIEILHYFFPEINSLKIVHDSLIQYPYKFEDRAQINLLYSLKGICDDILVIRDGMVTDTSFCNIVFSDGNKLYTPSAPLLKGTKRAQLIEEKIIIEKEIKVTDIRLFKKAYLINAMIDLEDNIVISTDKII